MPRNRVLSFMSTWGNGARSPSPDPGQLADRSTPSPANNNPSSNLLRKPPPTSDDASQRLEAAVQDTSESPSAMSRARGDAKPKRVSMMQTYNPPQLEVTNDTPPELQPIFTYMNSHSNKLYQEGYFLKLHDLDSRGRPSADRVWTECFAQLIGTVLSLWDAAALDVAGENAEVVPTFINLSDANIKMIESLPMNGAHGGNLQNVLSISTAANNRYLLHFNTLNSLTQWTAGIRLAMFEHSMLQEAYTGSLIAGKGRYLNNIKSIMFRLKYPYEDWARVRFGAGTPWQRCWCVISPPEEKEWEKAHKAAKKAGPYEKVKYPKGDIKFYDTRKVTKKTKPIATITDAFAAYAIYPQSKPLIEQSTLVKVEGIVTMHDSRGSSTEGFVFVMPEVHQMVSGFEMMLRWLFPAFDAFGLYGRPQKLVADTLDQRGLMFAMPTSRRYGHLDILDVSSLIHTKGSQQWSARQWRRELKKLTADRMMNQIEGTPRASTQESRRRNTSHIRGGVRFGSNEAARSTPGSRSGSPGNEPGGPPARTDSAPPTAVGTPKSPHKRSTSEAQGYRKYVTEAQSRTSEDGYWQDRQDVGPPPPPHGNSYGRSYNPGSLERINSQNEVPTLSTSGATEEMPTIAQFSPIEPVGPPPTFTHQANSRPVVTPYSAPEMRRANSNVDAETLAEMKDATSPQFDHGPGEQAWNGEVQQRHQYQPLNTVPFDPFLAYHDPGVPADRSQGAVNRMQQPLPFRDPRQRLSTIPGSPYVGEGSDYASSMNSSLLPRVNETPIQLPPSAPPPPPPKEENMATSFQLQSSRSIARKPVPRVLPDPSVVAQRPSAPERSLSDPTSAPMGESWEHIIINETAADQQFATADRVNTLQTTTTESTEPDYASTVASSPKKSMERPRAGKLKTVGDASVPAINTQFDRMDQRRFDGVASASAVPDVNFGPTYDYTRTIGSNTTRNPRTSRQFADRRRSRSADRLMDMVREAGVEDRLSNSAHTTPNEIKRRSYFAPEPVAPEQLDNRNVAWPPPAAPAPGIQRSQTTLTPEQWVQQRAMMARQAQYVAPKEAVSENVLKSGRDSPVQPTGRRKLTKERPLSRAATSPRPPSGDWTQAHVPIPPRPSSRGAGMNLETAGRSLSATEQMQVSRATGSPLVNLSQSSNRSAEPQPGLVSAVAQRERDKAASREGRNSLFLQQAIERERQQMRTEAEAQAREQERVQQQREYEWSMQQYQQQMARQYGPQVQRMQTQQQGWNPRASYAPSRQQSAPAQHIQRPQEQMGYGQSFGGHYGYSAQAQGQQPPLQKYGSSYTAQQQQQQQQYGR